MSGGRNYVAVKPYYQTKSCLNNGCLLSLKEIIARTNDQPVPGKIIDFPWYMFPVTRKLIPMPNKKSDVKAKTEFVKLLQERGFEAAVVSSPADIKAARDGETWYFEIKMTKRADVYFGAATLTEWRQALADPEHFRFVVAKTDEAEEEFEFMEFTPEEFMAYSTVPPFKIFFSIDLENRGKKRNGSKAVKLTKENFEVMDRCYEEIKQGNR